MKLEEANKRYAAYHRFKNNWLGWVFAIPTIILMYIFIWRPIVIGIAYSFFELKGYTPVRFIGLENYRQILSDTNFIQVLTNTFKYCGWSLLFSYFTPLIIAVMVNEMVRSKGYFKFTLYLPTMIPMVACCMLFKMIYFDDAGGLINMVITKLGGEPMRFLSNKAHVLPEERLNEAYNYKALVIPNVRNISRENLNIILDYMAKGGKVLLMGNDNILKDENNQDIEKELSDKVYAAAESLATVSEGALVKSPSNIEIRDFFHDYAKKLGGSRIGLIDPDTGKRLDNTEFEYGVYGDDIIINCCNYEYRAPKKFKVYIDGAEQKCKITELRSMKECENSTGELPSVLPIMIKIEGAAKLIK